MKQEELDILNALALAQRWGTEQDHPEGARYIKLSETQVKQLIRAFLSVHAESIRPCKRCRTQIFFCPLPSGKVMPFTAGGISHFRDCPYADEFSRAKKPEQSAMFNQPTNQEYPG